MRLQCAIAPFTAKPIGKLSSQAIANTPLRTLDALHLALALSNNLQLVTGDEDIMAPTLPRRDRIAFPHV